jgi:hypothetical protein
MAATKEGSLSDPGVTLDGIVAVAVVVVVAM